MISLAKDPAKARARVAAAAPLFEGRRRETMAVVAAASRRLLRWPIRADPAKSSGMRALVRTLLLLAFLAAEISPATAAEAKPVAVAIYTGPGVAGPGPGALKSTLDADPVRFSSRFLGPDELRAGVLAEFDLVVFPGGSGSKQAGGLGEEGREIVRRFVSEGGGYVGLCAGCYLACEGFSWSLKVLDAKTKSSKWRRGRKELALGVAAGAGELLGVSGESVVVKYANGPVMEPAGSPDLPDYTVLAVFNEEVAENETPVGIQVGSPAILTGSFGKGRVVGISPHPEQTVGFEGIVPRLILWAVGREPGTAAVGGE